MSELFLVVQSELWLLMQDISVQKTKSVQWLNLNSSVRLRAHLLRVHVGLVAQKALVE